MAVHDLATTIAGRVEAATTAKEPATKLAAKPIDTAAR
jgi:hypothetical protein